MGLVRRYLWLSQISLFALLLICTLIMPSVLEKNGGVSNFGEHPSTIVPYVLSFSLCIVFLCLAAAKLLTMSTVFRLPAYLLLLVALLELSVLASTFFRQLGWTYSVIHDDLGIALYAYEFVLSIWLVASRRTLQAGCLLCIETAGSVIGLVSAVKVIHLLYIGQIVGAIGFGVLLAATFPEVLGGACIEHDRSESRQPSAK